MLRYWLVVAALIQIPMGTAYAASDEPIRLELNVLENADGRCRVSFVIENKSQAALESVKLELAVFNRDGIVQRRLATELGPVRGAKTVVKAFLVDGACDELGAILVNEVAACTPGDANACLDRLALSSKVQGVRFYK
jgi:hypothetical protein